MHVDVYAIDLMNTNRPDTHYDRPGRSFDGLPKFTDVMYTISATNEHAVAIVPKEETVNDVEEQLSIFSSEEPPAKPSASQDFGRDLLTRGATSPSPSLRLLNAIAPSGWFGRTSPASYQIAQALSEPSSVDWQSSGMGGHTAFLTLNISDWPSDGSACSLSQVLEDGLLPQRYFLSPKACAGILRRAEARGKELPAALRAALEQAASTPARAALGEASR